MSVNLTPSRAPSGSPAFSPANRPVYRGGAVAGGGGGGGTDLTDSSGYPLDDDGTMAGAFSYGAMATSAPNYHLATHTYANGGNVMALAADVGAAMVTVGAGKKLGCQFAVTALPGTADFRNANLVAVEFSGGSPTGNSWNIALSKSGSILWNAIASAGTVPTSEGATALPAYNGAYVGGLVLDGDTGRVYYYNANGGLMDGTVGYAGQTFTPGNQIVFLLVADDDIANPVGQAIALRIIPNAADMIPLGFPSGVTDWNGQSCPSGGP